MVLIWIQAWAGSMGVWPRRSHGEPRAATARVDAFWKPLAVQLPAWRRRSRSQGHARAPAVVGGGVQPAAGTVVRQAMPTSARRRCWVRVDARARGHAAIGGSFAEVCAALERLAAIEDSRGC